MISSNVPILPSMLKVHKCSLNQQLCKALFAVIHSCHKPKKVFQADQTVSNGALEKGGSSKKLESKHTMFRNMVYAAKLVELLISLEKVLHKLNTNSALYIQSIADEYVFTPRRSSGAL